jgi:peptidoglycan/xylan/chitin deacetylase (PgdA/CDA1 family)
LFIYGIFEWAFRRVGWIIKIDHLFLYAGVLTASGVLSWICKKVLWPEVHMTLHLGFLIFIFGAIISIIPTWLFRMRAERWIDIIQERLAPLVWILGIVVIVSIPSVAYDTLQEIRMLTESNSYNADNNRPLVTFVFDDGYESTYTKAKPIFDEQGEVACAGITLDYIGKKGRMTEFQILELQNDGWEVLGHSITHPDFTTMTGSEIENEMKISKESLEDLGFKVVNFVYPFYKHNANARKIAGKYYRSARSGDVFTSGFNINPKILRIYALSAIDMDDFERPAALERIVDSADESNSWLMITYHNVTPHREKRLDSLIDYIQEKGIMIVTVNQGLDMVENKESIVAERLFILNNDSPFHMLRYIHQISQRILRLFHNFILFH